MTGIGTLLKSKTNVIASAAKQSSWPGNSYKEIDLRSKRLLRCARNDERWLGNDGRWLGNDGRWLGNDERWLGNDEKWSGNDERWLGKDGRFAEMTVVTNKA